MTHPHTNTKLRKIFFLQLLTVMIALCSCNNQPKPTEAPVQTTEDSTEVQVTDFGSDSIAVGATANKSTLLEIVFNGTIKEMGMPKKDVTILLYNSDGKELTGGQIKSNDEGKYTVPKTEITYPTKLVADIDGSHFLEVFVLKSPPAASDTTIDFNLSTYGAAENKTEHNLNVALKSGSNGANIPQEKVLFSSDAEGNSWSDYTNSDGVANFTHLAQSSGVCSLFVTRKNVFDFAFSMDGISRKANIRTSITKAK